MFDEDGDITLHGDDVDEASLRPCSWPTVVRITCDIDGHMHIHEFNHRGEWELLT
jgi:hypothetical protein